MPTLTWGFFDGHTVHDIISPWKEKRKKKKQNDQKLNNNSIFGPTITEKELKNEKKAKISFILAILNSLVWLITVLTHDGFIIGMYYMFLIGLVVNILTIIFGIFGIKSPKKNLAIASIILTIAPFLLSLIIIPLSLTPS